MKVLLIAKTLLHAQYILNQILLENEDQVTFKSIREITFKDGSSIFTASPVILQDVIRRTQFDQIFVDNWISKECIDYAVRNIAPRTMVPREFLVQVLDE